MDQTLGPYWSEPGWSISEGLYDRIPFPVQPNASQQLIDALPDLEGNGKPIDSKIDEPKPTGDSDGAWDASSALRLKSGTTAGKWHLKERWTIPQVEKCLRSWSSIKRYQEKNPSELNKGQPDIVGRVLSQLSPILGDEFDVHWPLVVQFIRRN